ncbi:response regulator [Henriciella algicola]|jgi:DNA-binding response OmpR family regulator|uniref:Response regulator n=1 Tax=Henriciella algicola TaxID=1608422 RepID=A0A399RNW2_9PROT|nr:response regulator [Henriciella algicola]RIJ31345.1 response regulator [Henriciella algicola]|tara:strand:+ start:21 stop:476 length:456 start_codon:yes stop_codon:yes gene_type:complete
MTSIAVPYEEILQRRILVIDDEEANLLLLETLLKREGYSHIHCLSDPSQAIEKLVEVDPHIILLDLMMPDIDGYQLLDSFRRQSRPDEFRPVLVLTADTTLQARRRALSLGAKDFVSKPFDVIEIALRISNLLETQILYERVQGQPSDASG